MASSGQFILHAVSRQGKRPGLPGANACPLEGIMPKVGPITGLNGGLRTPLKLDIIVLQMFYPRTPFRAAGGYASSGAALGVMG